MPPEIATLAVPGDYLLPPGLWRPSFLRPVSPCKDGRTLSSLRSISNCKPAACVSGVRMMRRIRFDPTATQFAGRSGLVTGMEPLSTYATSSIFSDAGMNVRDLFAEDVHASFRPCEQVCQHRTAGKEKMRPSFENEGRPRGAW